MSQDSDEEVAQVTKLLEGISAVCDGAKAAEVYTALTFCLGRVISISHDPANLLCLTILKIAKAAKIGCVEVTNAEELEELLDEHHAQSQSTH